MKQIFTFAIAAAAVLSANAGTGYLLKSIDEPQFAEYKNYEWDMEKLLLTREDKEDENVTYTTFEYDDQNRIVAEEQFQEMYEDNSDDSYWLRANRVEYTYNEAGHLALMQIINLPDTPGIVSITNITLSYDDNGTLTKITAYFAPSVDTPQSDWVLFQEIEYTFNDKGQRSVADWTVHSFGATYLSVRQEFFYDKDGYLRVVRDREPVEGSSSLMTRSNRVYEYTADGALEALYTTGSTFRFNTTDDGLFSEVVNVGNPSKRQEFIYDDGVAPENVLYNTASPYSTVYIGEDVMTLLKGKVIMEMLYERPNEDGAVLELYSTYDYDYYEVENDRFSGSGINTIETKPSTFFSAKANGNELTVSGNATGVVNIYDLNGRLMQTSTVNGGKVNISGLENGVYVVTSGLAAAKFVR